MFRKLKLSESAKNDGRSTAIKFALRKGLSSVYSYPTHLKSDAYIIISLTTFSAYLVPSRSSVNCIHFLPLTLTNENSVNKIWLLGVELMLLGNQTQGGILFRLLAPAGDIAVSDSHVKGKDDF